MGSFDSSGVFRDGVVAIGQSPLAAGGSTGLRVDIVDTANGNQPLPESVSVSFSSNCTGRGLSRINGTPATTFSGTANATYVAQGCSGADTVTASTTVNGSTLTSSGSLTVQPSSIGGIEFVSATPTTIGLRGSGQPETSTVVFRVKNASGGPVPQQDVSFTLNTTSGGVSLSPVTGKTDDTGTVQTVVRSGSTHTVVRVTATTTDSTSNAVLSSQSEQLTITTGIPDQDSFSLAVECPNVSGLDRNGTKVNVSVLAADRYNNPVPDGTAIAFTTEGGAIQGSCNTSDGGCSVEWTSQNPRPVSYGAADNGPRAGRSTILATAIGEESYTDLDGDGLFDTSESFVDLAEPFVDVNSDGVRQATESFIDFDSDGTYDAPDGRYNGLLCDAGGNTLTQCVAPRTTFVRASNLIVMAADSPAVNIASDVFVTGASFDGSNIVIPAGGLATISIVVRDINDQPMPNGTTIAATVADSARISGTANYTVPCTANDSAAANTYTFAIKANDAPNPPKDVSGPLEIKVTSNGLTTIFSFTVTSDSP